MTIFTTICIRFWWVFKYGFIWKWFNFGSRKILSPRWFTRSEMYTTPTSALKCTCIFIEYCIQNGKCTIIMSKTLIYSPPLNVYGSCTLLISILSKSIFRQAKYNNKMRVTSSLSIYAYGCGCGRGRGIYSFCGCVSIWWKKKKLYYTSHPYVSTLIQ